MGRRPRAWFQGAKYHITSRGNDRLAIFFDDEDRIKYLTLLEQTKKSFHYHLHAFCVMSNHTHLQVETTDTSPAIIMSYLNTQYAKYFNKKYGKTGHVFEKRYNAELLESLDYEFDCSRYIHRNPLKAGICDQLEDYPWSSYHACVNGEASKLVETKYLLSYFPNPASQHYERFVQSPLLDLFLTEVGKVVLLPRQKEGYVCVPK
nr:transposase [Neobacillus sp. Marseille-Q6967]